ncbi:HK97 family phage prohead protease [Wolbachia endosymbiont of Trichogramma kaykai]|uniref:HK97 family phage prohead protease n=1 Tax=Wolbachia endosymbiont of Trichogramma kaykai TaxID=444066 RepID=UPI0038914DE1
MSKIFLYSPLSIKSIEENGVFSGYASVFNIVDKQNDIGLYITAHLLFGIQKAEKAYLMLKTGTINVLSIGYIPIEYDVDHESGARVLKQVELWEVSLVTFPTNLSAQVINVKNHYNEQEVLARAIEKANSVLTHMCIST